MGRKTPHLDGCVKPAETKTFVKNLKIVDDSGRSKNRNYTNERTTFRNSQEKPNGKSRRADDKTCQKMKEEINELKDTTEDIKNDRSNKDEKCTIRYEK